MGTTRAGGRWRLVEDIECWPRSENSIPFHAHLNIKIKRLGYVLMTILT